MAQWMVTQRDNQFGVDTLGELVRMAKDARLVPGDMVQPPGAADWVYAAEIPELKDVVREEEPQAGMGDGASAALFWGIAAAMSAIGLVGFALAIYAWMSLPDGSEVVIGKTGLALTEMIATADAEVRSGPDGASDTVASLDKNEIVDLVAKRGRFYKITTKGGETGWVPIDRVLPAYQIGGAEAREKYDPLYNPDQYVDVANASWLMAQGSTTKTEFRMVVMNKSAIEMTDLELVAIVKDGQGVEIERVAFPVEGVIPPAGQAGAGQTFIGTLAGEKPKDPGRTLTDYTFQEMARQDPSLQLRWTDVVAVEMKNPDFSAATVDVVDVRAVPAEKNP